MRPQLNLLLFFALSIFISCGRNYGSAMDNALESAGDNKNELIKVLDHYSAPGDSLKLKAAEFLILNMSGHSGYQKSSIGIYSDMFSIIDTLSYMKDKVTNDDKIHIGDSVTKRIGLPDPDSMKTVPDNRLVSSGYLINNIDFAFSAWKNAPWAKKVSFNDFCEYILPYRIREEQLQYWRPQLYTEYLPMLNRIPENKNIKPVFDNLNWNLNTETNFTVFFNRYYPFAQSISDVLAGKIGGCETTSFYSATVMRSLGLPVAVDFILHWGSTNNSHFMVNAIDQSFRPQLITNENIQRSTWSVVDFSSDYITERHRFTNKDTPFGMYVQHVKTIPKVYRFTFSADRELEELNKTVPKDYLAPDFRKTNLRDVTDKFVKTSFFSLKVKDEFLKYKAAYLCVFDINGWKPIAVKKMNGENVIFDNLGCNVVYLPAVFDKGTVIPIAPPFYSDTSNVITSFTATNSSRAKIRLLRKYPLHSYTAYHTETLKEGRFEGSNSMDFTKADTLFTIKNYPFYMNEVQIPNVKKFRFLRYVAPPGGSWEADNIAEVQFYGGTGKELLKGKIIGKKGVSGHEIEKAFDDDLDSYYQNEQGKDGWIGIDLGTMEEKRVYSIKFCPRNDTNCILPGVDYELYYWDKKWISLGSKTADSYHLDYNKVPKNALFWLKGLNGGTEERIFTIENGQQKWW
ncbi:MULTISPECIES: hypothetical protein [Pedobacter]|uniref:hypothetical protein n=1 Tax=Pedobacter TaxID=84567 RepID=UPI002930A7A4|nr:MULTISPECIES: hypothetical protein [Pedobacter]